MENTEKRLRISNKIMGGFIMNEEINKKAEELNETGELSDAELSGASGGGIGFLKSYLDYQKREEETRRELAQTECPACKRIGARIDNMRIVCNSCGFTIR